MKIDSEECKLLFEKCQYQGDIKNALNVLRSDNVLDVYDRIEEVYESKKRNKNANTYFQHIKSVYENMTDDQKNRIEMENIVKLKRYGTKGFYRDAETELTNEDGSQVDEDMRVDELDKKYVKNLSELDKMCSDKLMEMGNSLDELDKKYEKKLNELFSEMEKGEGKLVELSKEMDVLRGRNGMLKKLVLVAIKGSSNEMKDNVIENLVGLFESL